MTSTEDGASELSKPRPGKAWTQLLAVVLGVLPVYLSSVVLQLRAGQEISFQGFTLYLAVIAPLSIVIAWLLLRFLCGEKLRELNLRPGRLSTDLLTVLILSIVIIVANVVSTFFFSALFPDSPSNSSVRDFFRELAGTPWMLVLFAGPLFFLGAASEEVIRVFLLWKVWPASAAKGCVVVVSAGLFGLMHLYQGPSGAAWTAVFGVIAALYYLRFGRVVPLILSHWVTNALQVIVFAAVAR
jgi:membrane protease YdiL (CAAX protease family)